MDKVITGTKLLAALLLAISLDACSMEPTREQNKELHGLVRAAIQGSALRADMKHGCAVSLEDQFRGQVDPSRWYKNKQRFGAVLFLGSEYVSMTSMVIEENDSQLVISYRDMDGQHPVRNVDQSKLKEIYALISSVAATSVPKSQGADLHDSCVVFVASNVGGESISVMSASATNDGSTPAGRASDLLQKMIE